MSCNWVIYIVSWNWEWNVFVSLHCNEIGFNMQLTITDPSHSLTYCLKNVFSHQHYRFFWLTQQSFVSLIFQSAMQSIFIAQWCYAFCNRFWTTFTSQEVINEAMKMNKISYCKIHTFPIIFWATNPLQLTSIPLYFVFSIFHNNTFAHQVHQVINISHSSMKIKRKLI